MLARGYLAALFTTLVVSADVVWEYTLPGVSPMIVYRPYGDGLDLEAGWITRSSLDGLNEKPMQVLRDEAQRVTSHNSASFLLPFFGNGIKLFGTANASYVISVDEEASKPAFGSGGMLYTREGLSLGDHVLVLTVNDAASNRILTFLYANITSVSPSELKSTIIPYNSQMIEYDSKDSWEIYTQDESGDWMTTNKSNASASLTFTGTRAVAIHSPLIWGHSTYVIELDGQIFTQVGNGAFNASTWWMIPESLLFFKDGLDPEKQHTLRLRHPETEDGSEMTVRSFEVWRVDGAAPLPSGTSSSDSGSAPSTSPGAANGGSSKHGTGLAVGAYAGITIGALAVVIVAAGIAWFALRRCAGTRRRRRITLDLQPDIVAADPSRTLLMRPQVSVLVPASVGTARSTTVVSHVSQPPMAPVAPEQHRLYPDNPPTYYSVSERGD